MLDLDETVSFGASRQHIPGFLTTIVQWTAGWRFDVDWDALDYIDRAEQLRVPILLFHGEEDDRIPIATSERLTRARPDLVSLIRVPDARHVRAWNVDPEGYAQSLRSFVDGLEDRRPGDCPD